MIYSYHQPTEPVPSVEISIMQSCKYTCIRYIYSTVRLETLYRLGAYATAQENKPTKQYHYGQKEAENVGNKSAMGHKAEPPPRGLIQVACIRMINEFLTATPFRLTSAKRNWVLHFCSLSRSSSFLYSILRALSSLN